MNDIFISYKREDQHQAKKIADALKELGWNVWWDPELRAGQRFDDVIDEALRAAKCVIVIWSHRSVASNYVKDEAGYALESGKLIPIAIDDAEPPFRYRRIETAQLIDWNGSNSDPSFLKLIRDIKAVIGFPRNEVISQNAEQESSDSWWQTDTDKTNDQLKQSTETTSRAKSDTIHSLEWPVQKETPKFDAPESPIFFRPLGWLDSKEPPKYDVPEAPILSVSGAHRAGLIIFAWTLVQHGNIYKLERCCKPTFETDNVTCVYSGPNNEFVENPRVFTVDGYYRVLALRKDFDPTSFNYFVTPSPPSNIVHIPMNLV